MPRRLLTLVLLMSCQPEAPQEITTRGDALPTATHTTASDDSQVVASLRAVERGFALDLSGQVGELVISRHGLELDHAGSASFRLQLADRVANEVRLRPCYSGADPSCTPRAELLHNDGLTEWWQPRASGIEHGFDITTPTDALRLPLQLTGAANIRVGEHDVVFFAEGTRWTYSGLYAHDAEGQPLDARFVRSAEGVEIQVDTEGAAFPVTVDPLLAHRFWRHRHLTFEGTYGQGLTSGYPPEATPGFPEIMFGDPFKTNDRGLEGAGEHFAVLGVDFGLLMPNEGGFNFQAIWNSFFNGENANFGYASAYFDHDADGIDAVAVALPGFPDLGSPVGRVAIWQVPVGSFRFENEFFLNSPPNTVRFGQALQRTGDLGGGEGLAVHGTQDGEGVVFIYRFPADAPTLEDTLTAPHTSTDLYPLMSRGDIFQGDGTSLLLVADSLFHDGEATVPIPSVLPWSHDGMGWYDHAPLLAAAPPDLGEGPPLMPMDGPIGAMATPPSIPPGDPEYPVAILRVAAADLDDDGLDDVVFGVRTQDGGSYVAAYLSDGMGAPHRYVRSAYAPTSLGTSLARAPFLLDGDTFVPGQPGLWDHTGDGVFAGDPDHNGAEGPETGRLVLLIYDADANALVPMWSAEGIEDGARLGTEVTTTDFNNDGELDVFSSAPGGTGSSVEPETRGGNIYGWISLRDSDRDGDPDITDCAPLDPTIYTGATEIPGEAVDRNCNGTILCWIDNDRDGYHAGQTGNLVADSCDLDGYGTEAMLGGDCNDNNPDINPGATEIPGEGIDRNCDGTILCWVDADNDGFHGGETGSIEGNTCNVPGYGTTIMPGGDCNDDDATINPAAADVIGDGVDRNCDGTIRCWVDADNDGFHSGQSESIEAESCDVPGYAGIGTPGGDCNDSDPDVNPGAAAIPGEDVDRNCDGTILCWADGDNDGYHAGQTASRLDGQTCSAPTFGDVNMPGGDCNDSDPSINPGATDLVGDGVDRNCDGTILCWVDGDDDGYHAGETVKVFGFGEPLQPEGGEGLSDVAPPGPVPAGSEPFPALTCDAPGLGGINTPGGDCDDTDPAINPGAADVAGEGIDRSCDGTILCWIDEDNDGFHNGETSSLVGESCDLEGYGTLDTPDGDCNDLDPTINPAATDVPGEGIDRNCDGTILCWVDEDNDGFHNGETATLPASQSCDQPGYGDASTLPGDCDDTDATINPDADDVPGEGIDRSCDGTILCWIDNDDDGFHAGETQQLSRDGDQPPTRGEALPPEGPPLALTCDAPGLGDLSTPGGDCDDNEPNINPGATDVPGEGIDRSCDGQQACWIDADGDGFHGGAIAAIAIDDTCDQPGLGGIDMPGGDCDDTDAITNPDATDVAGEGIDRSCDGMILCWIDADNDGFHSGQTATLPADQSCDQPGYGDLATLPGDCDDAEPTINPDADDIPGESIDRSCSGTILCWVDEDQDGYHADATAEISAEGSCADSGLGDDTLPGGDCDDEDPTINPGATDVPGEGVDRSCSGDLLCFIDDDDDGFHTGETGRVSAVSCDVSGHASSALPGGDCDDTDPTIHPNAAEIPGDGVDQDCDGMELCFQDADDDGLRIDDLTDPTPDLACALAGHAAANEPNGDCDDNNPDADNDRLRDGDEVLTYGTDPCAADSDGDGLSDGDEVLDHNTDPLNPDTDGGGIDDGVEVERGSDPLDPADDLMSRTWLASRGCSTTPTGSSLPLLGLLGLVTLALRRRET